MRVPRLLAFRGGGAAPDGGRSEHGPACRGQSPTVSRAGPESPLNKHDRIYIAGHRGLAGSAIWRRLEAEGYDQLIGATSSELDLRDRDAVFAFVRDQKPDVIVDAAARVGGIQANDTYSAEFLSDNLQIQVNLMDAANAAGVERLLFLGSSCIYPKYAE
ncbi:NAD-dependent epimerase/dehydratase family protein, partial [Schumannella luteola]